MPCVSGEGELASLLPAFTPAARAALARVRVLAADSGSLPEESHIRAVDEANTVCPAALTALRVRDSASLRSSRPSVRSLKPISASSGRSAASGVSTISALLKPSTLARTARSTPGKTSL
ncbi:hypothetical protein ACFU3E_37520 [Streptomyces sp. NPDC057424]|uniref:hypothetical protein n=1 Tax=Streptomyces sp. NPDC057424 TaxID=3346127 RepID=UPI00368A5500